MKKLKVFKSVSKHKLVATFFSLALITSLSTGCIAKEETGYYIIYTNQGKEVVLTEKEYNRLMETKDDEIIIRSYGGTLAITKENLLEALYQKEMPNSLHK